MLQAISIAILPVFSKIHMSVRNIPLHIATIGTCLACAVNVWDEGGSQDALMSGVYSCLLVWEIWYCSHKVGMQGQGLFWANSRAAAENNLVENGREPLVQNCYKMVFVRWCQSPFRQMFPKTFGSGRIHMLSAIDKVSGSVDYTWLDFVYWPPWRIMGLQMLSAWRQVWRRVG